MEAAGYIAGEMGAQVRENEKEIAVTATLPLLTALFALHTFLLMGAGTASDLTMAGADFGTALYYTREGVLVAGFLLYAGFARRRVAHPLSRRASDAMGVAMAALFAAGVVVLRIAGPQPIGVAAALVCSLTVGVSGGMVYERIALSAARNAEDGAVSHTLGPVVGFGGAIAVVLQFVLQPGFSLGVWLDICFVVCFCLMLWLARREGVASAEGLQTPVAESAPRPSAGFNSVPFACMVVAAICLFALLSFYEAALRSSGAVASFYEWHRLLLAAGYLVIGGAAYAGGRPAASVAVLVAALFAVIVSVQATLIDAGSLTMALFYVLLGAMFAWSCVAFMSIAPRSPYPAITASMGRILLAIMTLAEVPMQAVGDVPLVAVLAGSLALLAAVVLAMVRGGFLVFAHSPAAESPSAGQANALSPEERMGMLASECALTDREKEVLAALVLTENKNQQIADNLGMSRRQLQKHIARIYEKTGVETRAGLVMRAQEEKEHVERERTN